MFILNVFCDPLQNAVRTVFLHVLTEFHDSRPFQLPKYTVLHQESDVQVEKRQFWQLVVKNEEKRDK